MREIMFDTVMGNLKINTFRLVIGSSLKKSEFINSEFYKSHILSLEEMPLPYCWINLKPIKLFDYEVSIGICFNDEHIDMFHISVTGNDFPVSWETWSKDSELKRKEKNDELLKLLINKQPDIEENEPYQRTLYKFPWGEINSLFDPLSGSSFIKFSYD